MNGTSLRTQGLVAFAFSLGLGVAGCGVDVSEVFSSGSGGGVTTTIGGSTSGGGGSSTGGTTTSTGGTTTTTSMGGTTTTSMGGTTTTSMGGSTTTTTTTTMDPTFSLACGDQTCSGPADLCCWDKWGIGTGNPESGQCLTIPLNAGDCNNQVQDGGVQTVMQCTATSQCPQGQFCCGDVTQFQTQQGTLSYYPSVECRDSCDWPSRRMCDGQNDPICQQGTTCKQSQLLPPGVLVCGQ